MRLGQGPVCIRSFSESIILVEQCISSGKSRCAEWAYIHLRLHLHNKLLVRSLYYCFELLPVVKLSPCSSEKPKSHLHVLHRGLPSSEPLSATRHTCIAQAKTSPSSDIHNVRQKRCRSQPTYHRLLFKPLSPPPQARATSKIVVPAAPGLARVLHREVANVTSRNLPLGQSLVVCFTTGHIKLLPTAAAGLHPLLVPGPVNRFDPGTEA